MAGQIRRSVIGTSRASKPPIKTTVHRNLSSPACGGFRRPFPQIGRRQARGRRLYFPVATLLWAGRKCSHRAENAVIAFPASLSGTDYGRSPRSMVQPLSISFPHRRRPDGSADQPGQPFYRREKRAEPASADQMATGATPVDSNRWVAHHWFETDLRRITANISLLLGWAPDRFSFISGKNSPSTSRSHLVYLSSIFFGFAENPNPGAT